MGQHVVYDTLTLKQFLRLPEAKPALEYINGRVIQKVAAKRIHGLLEGILFAEIRSCARPKRLGLSYAELRCTFCERSLVFDVAFISKGRIPRGPDDNLVNDLFFPPDLAIEIISPGQTVKNLLGRLDWCVRNGVRLAWLFQPTQRRVFVVRPDRPTEILEVEDVLSGEEVVPGFALSLTELFGWLDED